MLKLHLSLIILLLCTIILLDIPSEVYSQEIQEIEVIVSNPDMIILDCNPIQLNEETIVIGNNTWSLWSLENSLYTKEIGTPQLPYLTYIVGLPPSTAVNVIIEQAEYIEYTLKNPILPVPTFNSEGIPFYQISKDIYSKDAFYPTSIVNCQEPNILHQQQITHLNVYPLQYNPKTNKLRYYHHIRFRIVPILSSIKSKDYIYKEMPFESMAKKIIINYDSAKHWRLLSEPKTKYDSPFEHSNNWYKIYIEHNGMYYLDNNYLEGAGIPINSINPNTIRMFAGNGLSSPADSLMEIAIEIDTTSTGELLGVLFYGLGLSGWQHWYILDTMGFQHTEHPYALQNVYWFTWEGDFISSPKRITNISTTGTGIINTTVMECIHEEENKELEYNADDRWYWYYLNRNISQTLTLNTTLTNIDLTKTANFTIEMKGVSGSHHLIVYINEDDEEHKILDESWIGSALKNFTTEIPKGLLKEGNNKVLVNLPRDEDDGDTQYLSWFEIEYEKQLKADADRFRFTNWEDIQYQWTVSGFTSNFIDVYIVSEQFDIKNIIDTEIGEVTIKFTGANETYYCVSENGLELPAGIEKADIINLRNLTADYVIITHKDFYYAVLPLQEWRTITLHDTTLSNPQAATIKVSQIYNEYSWGVKSPTAIKRFCEQLYNSGCHYILLVGDASIDYKRFLSGSRFDYIPSYLHTNYCTDDWYVDFDNNRLPEMYIGRLPAQNSNDAIIMVSKIIEYEKNPKLGPWRNTVTSCADDNYQHTDYSGEYYFTSDNQYIDTYIIPKHLNINKLYLIRYRPDNEDAMELPEANEDLLNQINDGTLIVYWAGHGSTNLLAHEYILETSSDLPRLQNKNHYPLMLAMSCKVGDFDEFSDDCMAERFVKANEHGAIAFFAASEVSWGSWNASLEKKFLTYMFQDYNTTLGEAIQLAKVSNNTATNDERYHLFGDPAMLIGRAPYTIQITISDSIAQGKQFHLTLLSTVKNSILYRISSTLLEMTDQLLTKEPTQRYLLNYLPRSLAKHKSILDAFKKYDLHQLRASIDNHFIELERFYMEEYE